MSYVLVVVVVLAVIGVVAWVVGSSRGDRKESEVEVDHTTRTDRAEIPPAHPDRPVPGSATDREGDGRS